MGNGILLLVIVAAPFAASLLAAFLPLKSHNAAATLAGATALFGIIVAVVLYPAIGGGIVHLVLPWIPKSAWTYPLRLDGFAWMFACWSPASASWSCSTRATTCRPRSGRALLRVLPRVHGLDAGRRAVGQSFPAGVLLGTHQRVLLSAHRLLAPQPAARDGARMALIITSAGGLCLLGGVLLLGHIAGSYDLDAVLAAGRPHPRAFAVPAGAAAGRRWAR